MKDLRFKNCLDWGYLVFTIGYTMLSQLLVDLRQAFGKPLTQCLVRFFELSMETIFSLIKQPKIALLVIFP